MSATADDDGTDLLAAEYALGVLDLADMRLAEARAAREPGFASEILFWQDLLAPLALLVPPVPPPAALWSRLALAAGIAGPASAAPGRRAWQVATCVSLALAACLAGLLLLPRPGAPPERFAAALAPLNSPAQFLAELRPDGSLAVVGLGSQVPPAGRDYQLWALPQGATAPVSLGILTPGGRIVPAFAIGTDTQLLVSEEPPGGSPTGSPTGPVVLGGRLAPVRAP